MCRIDWKHENWAATGQGIQLNSGRMSVVLRAQPRDGTIDRTCKEHWSCSSQQRSQLLEVCLFITINKSVLALCTLSIKLSLRAMDRKGKQRGNPESWNGKDVLFNLADNTVWQEEGSSLPNYLEENHQPTEGSSDTGDLSPFDRHGTRFVTGSEVTPPSSSLYGSDTATSSSGYSLQVAGLTHNLDGFSLNDADVSGSVHPQQPSTYEAQNPRPTPSTLGWPPGSGNVELYKLIFRSMDDMWLELKNKANLSAIIPWKVFLENPGSTSKNKYVHARSFVLSIFPY